MTPHKTPNQRIFDACLVIVAKAQRNGATVLARHEARRLSGANPDADLSEVEIYDYLLGLAVTHRLSADTAV